MRIVKIPNGVLRCTAKPVLNFDKELKRLIDNMCWTMTVYGGVGLAAPQVGISQRLFVARVEGKVKAFINPEIFIISDYYEEYDYAYEGCLSIPGKKVNVRRAKHIQINYQDRKGNYYTEEYWDFDARVIQHEFDHLQGKLIIDYH